MLDEKKIERSSRIIKQLIEEGKIVKPSSKTKSFFLDQSNKSLVVSRKLLDLQEKENIDTNLWVINTAYYSMFFGATALLAHFNHKLDVSIGVHKATYHALVYYFVKEDNKLKKQLAEEYATAVSEAEEVLQIGESKIKELVISFDSELEKRKIFTYEIEESVEKAKAITSLKRAENFFQEINKILRK
ncbi:hypothetical protein HY837_06035 [archaeon]|nr:hypothetical protein [archaeon]